MALAAAKREVDRGERGRLIESDAPVEEFLVRGRRVLIKRDDKVCMETFVRRLDFE